eukprot:1416881-Rhodomonas_salina.4
MGGWVGTAGCLLGDGLHHVDEQREELAVPQQPRVQTQVQHEPTAVASYERPATQCLVLTKRMAVPGDARGRQVAR